MSYSEETKKRIETSKQIADKIRELLKREKEEWHIFIPPKKLSLGLIKQILSQLFSRETRQQNSKLFRIVKTTKRRAIGLLPRLILFEVEFTDNKATVRELRMQYRMSDEEQKNLEDEFKDMNLEVI